MLMEKMGYILSEAPLFLFMVWFTIRLVQYRRWRRQRPVFSDIDRRLLFGTARRRSESATFCFKFILAIVATTLVGILEFIALAPLGAALLTGALILTSATIVQRILPLED
jgi:hypothetical protein